MRAGICSVQQALTAEAASTVKQAVSLARRRGHSQVTPLHVATSMLSCSTSLLRKACFQSHSHPLQSRALELCFNIALNRLPASNTSTPLLLGGTLHSPLPSPSNALIAAFKRAQAHQRRGSIENQQQPILALKIEIEQLIISILDDPSVSRVMREAGFSSTQVKSRVEQAVSLETSNLNKETNTKPQVHDHQSLPISYSHLGMGVTLKKPMWDHKTLSDDIERVLNLFMSKRENSVIVGECLATNEAVVKGVIDKFEKGNISGDLRYLQFISLPLLNFRNLSKEQVEKKLVELRYLVKGYLGRGAVLYLGDLEWVSEYWSSSRRMRNYEYSPVEHMIMELKRIVSSGNVVGEDERRLWLMGIASSVTYTKCKTGYPSLETMLDLHPITFPQDNLTLSLNLDSDSQTQYRSNASKVGSTWAVSGTESEHKHLLGDTSLHFYKEAKHNESCLPSWLQDYKQESRRNSPINDQECSSFKGLRKWNSFSDSVSRNPYTNGEKILNFSSLPPSPSTSITSHEHKTTNLRWPIIFETQNSPKEHQFWRNDEGAESLPKPDLLSNPNSSPNSASSSEAIEEDTDGLNMFKQVTTENLSILCDALEKTNVDQKEIILDIATTILKCRSGLMNKKPTENENENEKREETWLLFLGEDRESKEKIGKELARTIFGTESRFMTISSKQCDHSNKKRKREENNTDIEKLAEALNENPSRVFFIEDFVLIDDDHSQKGVVLEAIESGNVKLDELSVPLKDGIVIFSVDSYPRPLSTKRRQESSGSTTSDDHKEDDKVEEEKSLSVALDLNIAIEDKDGEVGILEAVDKQIIFKNRDEI